MGLISAIFSIVSKILIERSRKWQIVSPLRDLDLWDCGVSSSGNLLIADADSTELVEQYGSPLLVVSHRRLIKDSQAVLQAMTQAPLGSKVLYSYKTNCIPGILKTIHGTGIGAEVISPYELWVAERLQVPGEMIVYNGVDKTDESLRRAIEMGVLAINIDHREEVKRICRAAQEIGRRARVGIRLGLSNGSQFGLSIDTGEAMEACREIASNPELLDFNCIHFSVTSNAKNADTHKTHAQLALNFISKLKQELNIEVEYLDLGGGYGVPTTKNMTGVEYGLYRTFGCLPKTPLPSEFQEINSFIGEIVASVKASSKRLDISVPKLLIEPGRFVTSRSEVLLTKVLTIKKKQNGTQYLITDAGRLSMTFPSEFEYHEIFVANRARAERDTNYQVMGRICTAGDWLAKNRFLPKAQPNDVLAVMDAGAYFSSYSSTFAFPRPGIICIDSGRIEVLRYPETYEYLTELDQF
jgi:diaminopimelate decarboxylase